MTRQTLRAVTLDTVATATRAAERTVGAYRAGGHRLVAVIQQRVTAPTADRAQPYAPRLAAALRNTSSQAGNLADKGIDLVSDRTEQVIGVASKGVTAQVKRVAQLAEGVDNRVIANGLDTAARLTLPGVQAALALTARLADGADNLARTAAGPKAARGSRAKKAVAKAPVRRTATQTAKKPAAPLAEVVQAVAKPARRAAASVKRTMGSVKAAAQPVVKAATQSTAQAPKAPKAPQAAKPRAPRRTAAPVVSTPATEAAAA